MALAVIAKRTQPAKTRYNENGRNSRRWVNWQGALKQKGVK